MALIPPLFFDAVVSIGNKLTDGTIRWIGTGFMVGRPIEKSESSRYHIFIVTNKHVLQGLDEVIIRYINIENGTTIDYTIELSSDSRVTYHPNNTIDVAAISINPDVLKKDGAAFTFFELDNHAWQVEQMKTEGVMEGDGLFVLGYPLGLVDANGRDVIARWGIIAKINDLYKKKQTSYLIDSNIYPGSSGGPVIIKTEFNHIDGTKTINRACLIGMVRGYITYQDTAISQQTGKPKIVFEENSGLGVVETVDSIKETVELCYNKYVK